jgi:hypothetical protein
MGRRHDYRPAFQVVDAPVLGIHGERTDWIPRAEIILSDDQKKTFEPFDR